MKNSAMVCVVVCFAVSAFGEFRMWTDQNGNRIEAEFTRISGRNVILIKRDGKQVTVSPMALSTEDQEYLWGKVPDDLLNPSKSVLERENPPRMEIKASKIMNRRKTDYDKVDCDLRYEITIKRRSSPEYDHTLKAVLYVLGISKEHQYYVMLDKKEFEFDFKQAPVVEFSGNEVGITYYRSQNYGVEYEGYLVVITDEEGNELEVQGSSNTLEDAKDTLARFNKRDVFSKAFKKKEAGNIGTYLR